MAQFRMQFPQFRSAATTLTVIMVAVSVVVKLFAGLGALAYLIPAIVLTHPWTPFTYGFISTEPLNVIFNALIVISIGGALEQAWGSRRLVVFAMTTTVLAGLATVLLALLWRAIGDFPYAGGSVMSASLWVAYGLSVGARQTNFWGLPVTGFQFAFIGAGFTMLNAVFYGLPVVVPSAFALFFTYLASRGITPSNAWLRVRSWQLSRQLNRRATHLKVVSGDKRNMPNDSDRFLH